MANGNGGDPQEEDPPQENPLLQVDSLRRARGDLFGDEEEPAATATEQEAPPSRAPEQEATPLTEVDSLRQEIGDFEIDAPQEEKETGVVRWMRERFREGVEALEGLSDEAQRAVSAFDETSIQPKGAGRRERREKPPEPSGGAPAPEEAEEPEDVREGPPTGDVVGEDEPLMARYGMAGAIQREREAALPEYKRLSPEERLQAVDRATVGRTPEVDYTITDRAVQGLKSGGLVTQQALGSVLEAIGNTAGWETISGYGEDIQQDVDVERAEARAGGMDAPKFTEIDSPEEFGEWAAYASAEGLSTSGTMIGGGILGSLLGGSTAATAGVVLPAYALSHGILRNAFEEEGMEGGELEAWTAAGAVPLAGLEMLMERGVVTKAWGNTARRAAIDQLLDVAQEAGRASVRTGGSEALTEGAQFITEQGLVAAATGRKMMEQGFSTELIENVAGGAAGGTPFGASEVAFERTGASLREANRAIRREMAARLSPELVAEAETDPLTGLDNRRGQQRKEERREPAENVERHTFVGDVDNMKAINDNLGHEEGDRALQVVASALRDATREDDVVSIARPGGDEFEITMDLPEGENPGPVLQRIEDEVNETLSEQGYVEVDSTEVGFSLGASDRGMYERKAERGVSEERGEAEEETDEDVARETEEGVEGEAEEGSTVETGPFETTVDGNRIRWGDAREWMHAYREIRERHPVDSEPVREHVAKLARNADLIRQVQDVNLLDHMLDAARLQQVKEGSFSGTPASTVRQRVEEQRVRVQRQQEDEPEEAPEPTEPEEGTAEQVPEPEGDEFTTELAGILEEGMAPDRARSYAGTIRNRSTSNIRDEVEAEIRDNREMTPRVRASLLELARRGHDISGEYMGELNQEYGVNLWNEAQFQHTDWYDRLDEVERTTEETPTAIGEREGPQEPPQDIDEEPTGGEAPATGEEVEETASPLQSVEIDQPLSELSESEIDSLIATLAAGQPEGWLEDVNRLREEQKRRHPEREPPQVPDEAEAGPEGPSPLMEGQQTSGAEGAETTLRPVSGDPIEAQYKVVPADELRPSHNPFSFDPRANYPQDLQPRSYDQNRQAQESVAEFARTFDPNIYLDRTELPASGPSQVSPTGIVLGGNNRVMSIQRVYANDPEKADQFREAQIGRAPDFGLEREEVARVENPVIVREITDAGVLSSDADELADLGARLNEDPQKASDPLDEAATLARRLESPEAQDALDLFLDEVDPEETLRSFMDKAAGRRFMEQLVQLNVVPHQESGRYFTDDGAVTSEAKDLVERLFKAAVIKDRQLLSTAPASAVRKIEKAVPAILDAAQVEGYDVRPEIVEAMRLLRAVRGSDFETMEEFLAQESFLGEDWSPQGLVMARFLDENTRNPVSDGFRAFAADAAQAEEAMLARESGDLFGDPPPIPDPAQKFARRFDQQDFSVPEADVPGLEGSPHESLEGPTESLSMSQGDMFAQSDAPAGGGEQFDMFEGEAKSYTKQNLTEAERQAAEAIRELGPKVDNGNASQDELAIYNESRKLLNRSDKFTADELRILARENEAEEVPQAEGQQDIFGPREGLSPKRGTPTSPTEEGYAARLSMEALSRGGARMPETGQFRQEGEGPAGEAAEGVDRWPAGFGGKYIPPRQEIIDELAHTLKVPISQGKAQFGGAYGFYKVTPEAIRLKWSQDMETAAHEIGHHLHKLLFGDDAYTDGGSLSNKPLDPWRDELEPLAEGVSNESLKEGEAEFFRRFITTEGGRRAKEAAPQFYEFVEETLSEGEPAVWNALLEARRRYQQYRNADALDRVMAEFVDVGSKKSIHLARAAREAIDEGVREIVDNVRPIQQYQEAIAGRSEEVPLNEAAELLARVASGAPARADMFLKHHRFDALEHNRTGPPLVEILAPVQDRMREWVGYAVAMRARERRSKGYETGIRKEDAQELIERYDGEPGFREALEGVQEFRADLLNYLVEVGALSERAYQNIMEKSDWYMPFYSAAEEHIQRRSAPGSGFQNVPRAIHYFRGSSGMKIHPIDALVQDTYLFMDIAARQRVANALFELGKRRGSGWFSEYVAKPVDFQPVTVAEALRGIKEQIGKRTADIGPEEIQAAMAGEAVPDQLQGEARRVGEELEAAVSESLEELPDDVLAEIFMVMRPGDYFGERNMISIRQENAEGEMERYWFEIHDDGLYEAITGEEHGHADSWLLKSIFPRWAASTLRVGATVAPIFSVVRNPQRDMLTSWIQSEFGLTPGVDHARAAMALIGKGEWYERFKRGGGEFGALVDMDRNEMMRQMERFAGERGKVTGVIKDLPGMARNLSALFENVSRMAEFQNAYEEFIERGMPRREAEIRAGAAARDNPTDFARHGAGTAAIRQSVAFWNAALQGYDKMYRTFKNNPVRTSRRALFGITLPSMLLLAVNWDNEDYWELPEWLRFTFWHIPIPEWMVRGADWVTPDALGDVVRYDEGEGLGSQAFSPFARTGDTYWLRFAKPHALGHVFGSVPEKIVEVAARDGQDVSPALGDLWREVGRRELLTFLPLPTMWEAVQQLVTGYDLYYQSQLVPQHLQNVEAEYQYTPSTSHTAKMIADVANEAPGVELSPIKLEAMVTAIGGTLGREAMRAGDIALEQAGLAEPRPGRGVQDIPLIGGAFTQAYVYQPASVADFWQEFQQVQKYNATVNKLEREQAMDELREYRTENAAELQAFAQLQPIAKFLRMQSRQIDRVWYRDPPEYLDDDAARTLKFQDIRRIRRSMADAAERGLELVRRRRQQSDEGGTP